MPGTNYEEALRSRRARLGAMPAVSLLLSCPQTLKWHSRGVGCWVGVPLWPTVLSCNFIKL